MKAIASLGVALALITGAASAQPADPKAVSVSIKNFDFSSMATTIPVGGSVTWKNLDGEPHTVVGLDGGFRSPPLDQNDSFTFKFEKVGTYRYICSLHPQMKATVVVK